MRVSCKQRGASAYTARRATSYAASSHDFLYSRPLSRALLYEGYQTTQISLIYGPQNEFPNFFMALSR